MLRGDGPGRTGLPVENARERTLGGEPVLLDTAQKAEGPGRCRAPRVKQGEYEVWTPGLR